MLACRVAHICQLREQLKSLGKVNLHMSSVGQLQMGDTQHCLLLYLRPSIEQ